MVWLFYFTALFFTKKDLWLLLPIATLFTSQISFDLCYFALPKGKIKYGGIPKKMKKVVYSIKKVRGNSDDKISDLVTKKERC